MKPTIDSLGKTADAYYKAREKRLEADKISAKLKEEETRLANLLIATLAKDTTGVAGKLVRVYVDTVEQPKIVDRDKFMAWVGKHKAWELVPASVNKAPWRERTEDGEKIPGLDTILVPKLHCNLL
jgi:hypothetical protein